LQHCILALLLLKAGVLLVDNVQPALPPHDLTVGAAFFDGCPNFHFDVFNVLYLFIPKNDPSPGKVVRAHLNPHLIAGQYADVVHPHFARNRGQYLVVVLQFYLEHGIAQGLYNDTVLLYKCLFGHNFGSAKIRVFILFRQKIPIFTSKSIQNLYENTFFGLFGHPWLGNGL
jgi:hypothetical protein